MPDCGLIVVPCEGAVSGETPRRRVWRAALPCPARLGGVQRWELVASGLAAVLAVSSAPADDVQRWIRQLGADGFAERQAAHEQLLQRGPELLPRLREAAAQGDPEVRLRAAQLSDRLREAQFEVLLRHLIAHPEQPAPEGLPAWQRYADITGDDVAARALYADMVRVAPDLMWQLETDDEHLAASLRELIAVQFGTLSRSWIARAEEFPAERTALLLLLSVEQEAVNQPEIAERLNEWLGPALLAGDAEAADSPLRRLAGAWVASSHTSPRGKRMELARLFGLPEGILPARQVLLEPRPATIAVTSPGLNPAVEQQDAILLLARFGDIQHLPDLEPLLADATEINVYQRRREVKFQTRLQDIALIALLHLTGQAPADYGFAADLTENAQTVYAPQSVGFTTEQARQAALAQWRRWRVVHLQSRRFAPLDAVEGTSL